MVKKNILIIVLIACCILFACFFGLEYKSFDKVKSSITLIAINILYILMYRRELLKLFSKEFKVNFPKKFFLFTAGSILIALYNSNASLGFIIPKVFLGCLFIITSIMDFAETKVTT